MTTMLLEKKSFADYLSEEPGKLFRKTSVDTVRFSDLDDEALPFSIAQVDRGLVNSWFHMADPEAGAYVPDQQNTVFRNAFALDETGDGNFSIPEDQIVRHAGSALVIGGQRNHWHFLINFMPRLMQVEIFAKDLLDSVDTIVIHGEISGFQEVILKELFPEEKLLKLNRNEKTWHQFDTLYFPSMVLNTYYHLEALQKTRDFILSLLPPADMSTDSKGIFVDRKFPTPRRRLANGRVVLPILEKRNIQRVFSEDYTAQEQIMLFHKAPVVVGLHGAGFANLLFCKPGASVVIVDYKWPSEMYGLAYVLGLNPIQLLARQVTDAQYEARNPGFQPRLRDFAPNHKQVDAALCTAWILRDRYAPTDG